MLQKKSKHVPMSVHASSARVVLSCCRAEWMSLNCSKCISEQQDRYSVFIMGTLENELLQTTKLMLGAGFLLQTGRGLQAQICSVYIPALLAPPWSTAVLHQTNALHLWPPTPLSDQQNKNNNHCWLCYPVDSLSCIFQTTHVTIFFNLIEFFSLFSNDCVAFHSRKLLKHQELQLKRTKTD